jgi:O-methyltransferase domain/Dimerisation domain
MNELRHLVNGFQVSQAIHAAVALGIPDLLADGPRASDQLADASGADSGALYRLLRALASVGVLDEGDERTFSLTPFGEPLRSDVPDSLHGWASFVGRPYYWEAWGQLVESVRTGENAFRRVHGMEVWEYRTLQPEEGAIFDGAMTALTRRLNRGLLAAYDFGRFGTVVDVGGGQGVLLAAILEAHPSLRGVLFDQPGVVAGAGYVLRSAGVADRCRVVGGDFFEAVPAGGDAYVLKMVVHDWEDQEAAAILRSCRAAMPAGAALLVVERVVGAPNEGRDVKFSDLNMLVAPGGRERTLEELRSLFAAAGFELAREVPADGGVSIVEGAPQDE